MLDSLLDFSEDDENEFNLVRNGIRIQFHNLFGWQKCPMKLEFRSANDRITLLLFLCRSVGGGRRWVEGGGGSRRWVEAVATVGGGSKRWRRSVVGRSGGGGRRWVEAVTAVGRGSKRSRIFGNWIPISSDSRGILHTKRALVFNIGFYIAGTKTSSNTTEWTMTKLLLNPDMFSRVLEEVSAIVGENVEIQEAKLLVGLSIV
ncbi:hypothetical protein OSB04_022548 [Centaurea solstitialis]|uniref:Uncharacterized protein n=1 Tax=Centaurea solstitialis TaxID=347529 RepID=A0AA38SWD7_9ASTR|nr:hypothetical protein OSB04_022548 [Centaurea solstitialis]